jgi:hypothetical protein
MMAENPLKPPTTLRLSDETRQEMNAALLDLTAHERRSNITQDEVILRAMRALRVTLGTVKAEAVECHP